MPIGDIDPMADTSLQGPDLPDLSGNCPLEGALFHNVKSIGSSLSTPEP